MIFKDRPTCISDRNACDTDKNIMKIVYLRSQYLFPWDTELTKPNKIFADDIFAYEWRSPNQQLFIIGSGTGLVLYGHNELKCTRLVAWICNYLWFLSLRSNMCQSIWVHAKLAITINFAIEYMLWNQLVVVKSVHGSLGFVGPNHHCVCTWNIECSF